VKAGKVLPYVDYLLISAPNQKRLPFRPVNESEAVGSDSPDALQSAAEDAGRGDDRIGLEDARPVPGANTQPPHTKELVSETPAALAASQRGEVGMDVPGVPQDHGDSQSPEGIMDAADADQISPGMFRGCLARVSLILNLHTHYTCKIALVYLFVLNTSAQCHKRMGLFHVTGIGCCLIVRRSRRRRLKE
jgi:hypothetical protein